MGRAFETRQTFITCNVVHGLSRLPALCFFPSAGNFLGALGVVQHHIQIEQVSYGPIRTLFATVPPR